MTQYKPLEPLPELVYFVRNDPALCEKLANISEMPTFEEYYRQEQGGSSSWIVQTYLQLKCRGLDVKLVPHYVPNAICVVSREELMKRPLWKELPFKSYLVVCQQDRPRPFICEHRIVQNQQNALTSWDHFLPHWPQPDLKARNQDRSDRVENLVFKGRWYYIPKEYKNPEFLARLQSLGFNFITSDDYPVKTDDWMNYSEADVLLAVRQQTDLYLESKPPTKLFNAWLAGCPALLGAEPAYQALRESDLDYIEVNSPDDVVEALQRLRNHPDLYHAMIENGWKRGQEFTPDNIAKLWRDLLAGAITEGYQQWKQQTFLWRTIGRPVQFTHRLVKQEQERRYFNRVTGRKR